MTEEQQQQQKQEKVVKTNDVTNNEVTNNAQQPASSIGKKQPLIQRKGEHFDSADWALKQQQGKQASSNKTPLKTNNSNGGTKPHIDLNTGGSQPTNVKPVRKFQEQSPDDDDEL